MINVALDIDFSTSPIHINNGGKLEFHSRKPEKGYFNIEIVNLLANSKLGQWQKLLHCNLHLFSRQNY